MTWFVKITDIFPDSLKTIRKNKKDIAELNTKIWQLQQDHLHVGGCLSGDLHGKKSTIILKIIQEDHSNACRIK